MKGGKMKGRQIWSTILLSLSLISFGFAQSRETGAIEGTVKDDQGNPLPGVTVSVSSPSLMGVRTFITDAEGKFRFPALPPGDYTVKAELQGFTTVIRENIRLTTTVRLTVDLVMKPATLAEEVTVLAKAPTVDVKSTETASVTLANEILRNIPYSQFTTHIVNLAPAVTANVAYGASQNTGIAYSVDGVNVADPEAGSAWVFLDHNIIEEAKIMGVGLPAEYGNFTGVIFNLVTKSGGNNLAGHIEAVFQGEKNDWPKGFWQQDNNKAYTDDFPELTSPRYRLIDANAHLGGPIKRDKYWYYVGTQFQQFADWATGFPEPRQYNQPRLFTKLTSQLDPTLNIVFSLEVDTYDGKNRGASATTAPDAVVNQKSPEIVGNFSLTKILSPKTFFDVKAAYFWGYYYLDPEAGKDKAMYFSLDENFRYSSSGYFFYADRTRFQANASLTHYAEDFIKGDHDFKFGVEIERSTVRNRYGYTGPNHMNYFGYGNPTKGWEHYLAYQYEGYDTNTRYTRFEAFAQDSWSVTPRLNISAGVRFSQNWGTIRNVEGIVYNTRRVAPRIGFTLDVFGDKTTVLKGHYGQFTEGMFSSYHDRLNPASAYSDYIGYYWDGSEWVEFMRLTHEELYSIADDIKHPYLNQYTVSLERELFTDASFSVAYIYREWKNIIGRYDTLSDYRQIPISVGYHINKTFNIYELTTGDAHAFVLDNIKKGQPWVMLDPFRKYRGIEFLFNKRFSHSWQLLLSYVYSKAWGTMDNGFADDIGLSDRDGLHTGDPNFWINAEGHSTVDPTHMFKLQGTYIIPFVDISFSAYFRAITGNTWTTRYRTKRLAQGRVTFFVEPRGSHHYPMQKILDVRLEKIFRFADKYRFGVMLDVFNVLNANTITSWGTRIGYDWLPDQWESTDGHQLYSIIWPRQVRLGLRLIF